MTGRLRRPRTANCTAECSGRDSLPMPSTLERVLRWFTIKISSSATTKGKKKRKKTCECVLFVFFFFSSLLVW